jgi:hypothetical protein
VTHRSAAHLQDMAYAAEMDQNEAATVEADSIGEWRWQAERVAWCGC